MIACSVLGTLAARRMYTLAIFAHFTDEELVENLAEATIPQADLKQEWVGFGLAQCSLSQTRVFHHHLSFMDKSGPHIFCLS